MIAAILAIIFSQGDTCFTCAWVTAKHLEYRATSSYSVAVDTSKVRNGVCFQTQRHGCVDLDSLVEKIDEVLELKSKRAVVTGGSTK